MQVNGQEKSIVQGTALLHFLKQEGYDSRRVAIERNGQIVPKNAFESTILEETDILEIVQFVGGG